MPKVTIVRDDQTVQVEGVSYAVDLADLPNYIHAVQWDGVKGEIEFAADADNRRLPNMRISDFGPFQHFVMRWEQAHRDYQEAARMKAQEEAERAPSEPARNFTPGRSAVQRKLENQNGPSE